MHTRSEGRIGYRKSKVEEREVVRRDLVHKVLLGDRHGALYPESLERHQVLAEEVQKGDKEAANKMTFPTSLPVCPLLPWLSV